MELPHIGQNCALKQCNKLDFLPVRCDACSNTFCIEHYKYEAHRCVKAHDKNVQVPVCPLCLQPVVAKRGQVPDIAVSEHIDRFCDKNDLIKHKPTTSKRRSNLQACAFKSCKQKDLIYLQCTDCGAKFCIKHRHPSDHACSGAFMKNNIAENWNAFKGSCSSNAITGFGAIKSKAQQISKSGQAALNRLTNSRSSATSHSNNTVSSIMGNLSEQEALAIALSESQSQSCNVISKSTETEDAALARALQESEQEARRRAAQSQSRSRDNCVLS